MPALSRRDFLQSSAIAAGIAPWVSTTSVLRAGSANEQVNIGCIGIGGKGASDLAETSVGHNIVALCDTDAQRLAQAAAKFPQARTYSDWRQLLEQADIDAVTVSTPDHTHAPATMTAMQLGKHVFTQKPLTHTVYEARRLSEVAAEKGLVTQMGIQHHATARLKIAVQVIRDGVIGPVSEVHAWTDRPVNFWKQGLQRPKDSSPVPDSLDWNQWLGVAPERPFVEAAYHPFHWRGWWDFGTGVAGDMGCHLLDPVVNALELGPPSSVVAEGPPPLPESGPAWCILHYEFPQTAHTTPNLKLHWYEAKGQPRRELFQAPADWPGSDNGVLFIGAKGNLFVGFPEMPELFPKGDFSTYKLPEFEDHNHYTEWTMAIATGGKTSCPFAYSGPLTETVLLGNVAHRTGRKIHWDSPNLKAIDCPEADQYLRKEYRKGWEVAGL